MSRAVSPMNSTPKLSFRDSTPVLNLALALLVVFAAAPFSRAQTYTVLHTFSNNGTDGAVPSAGLVQDAKGNLYGTTADGGQYLYGTVFKLTPAGKETILHPFGNGADGKLPMAALTLEPAGNLYGTTSEGGASGAYGTVFGLNKAGDEILLYSFGGPPNDGGFPQAGLVRDGAGNLYGTTSQGGHVGVGTVFKLSKTAGETVVYNFCSAQNCTDGGYVLAGLLRDAKGNLYGTTNLYGKYMAGVVFKVDTTGAETVLYNFCLVQNCPDGSKPAAGLIQDAAGNFYGTTTAGGKYGAGTVFKLSKSLKETVLYSFQGLNDGGTPVAGVIQDAAGNFYGTTKSGGKHQNGTVFKLAKGGKESVLHSFTGGKDGGQPLGSLIRDAQGNLYGTASAGGDPSCPAPGCGVVFKIIP
jgi:uncharacterized repeat protein (TIGR03803 family)